MASLLILLLAPILILCPAALAEECIDYREYARWVGGVETWGIPRDIAVDAQHAYVAVEENGRPLPSGVCLISLSLYGRTETQRLVRIR